MLEKIKEFLFGPEPGEVPSLVCPKCGAPMMKTGYPKNWIQDYKCKLRTFTGYCCAVNGCEETAVTSKDLCPKHLVEGWDR